MTDKAVVLIGCGYAADFYMACLAKYSHLKVVGAYDIDNDRATMFCHFHDIPRFASLAEALDYDAIVANLTSIESHYHVTKEALHRGRHVFSEKPLALTLTEATELHQIARTHNLLLSAAPSTVLGPCHTMVREALRRGLVGRPLVVHANLEDGAVHKMDYRAWISPSGQLWPAREEFAAGPVLEHAGYQLTWLVGLFGGVAEMVGTTTTVVPQASLGADGLTYGPNLALWNITHKSGVVTRLTCGGIAPRDYSMTIVGEQGVLDIQNVMRLDSDVTYRREQTTDRQSRISYLGPADTLRYSSPAPPYDDTHYVDFAAGIAEMAACMRDGSEPHLGSPLSVHVLELVLEIITPGSRIVQPKTIYPAGGCVGPSRR